MKRIAAFILLLISVALPSRGQEIRNITFGWGHAVRLGRWTPVFVTVEDPEVRAIDLQIHGSYGEKGEALWMHQSAVAQPAPVTYELLYAINAQLSQIEVIVSDAKTGRTLDSRPLQNISSFTPAGKVPMQVIGPNDLLIGISGNIDDAQSLSAQLKLAGVEAGMLDPLHLPSNFAGYEGVSVLILAAPDFAGLKPEQEQSMLEWVSRGGNLVVIPPTTAIPEGDLIAQALPATIGENGTISASPLDEVRTRAGPGEAAMKLNVRTLSPKSGVAGFDVLGRRAYWRSLGLGKIAVIPVDFAPLQSADATAMNSLWASVLLPMVKIPPIQTPTSMLVAEEDQTLVSGPNAAQSVGRGRRESDAISQILQAMGAAESVGRINWSATFLWLAALGFLLGPVDSIILMRLGQRPRNIITLAAWLVLIGCGGGYVVARESSADRSIKSFRLIDQVDDETVAATEIVAVNSNRPQLVNLALDGGGWWEPANQVARLLRADRFVDAECREDKTGCRPESIALSGLEAQAWHGEMAGLGRAWITADVHLETSLDKSVRLRGTLVNRSAHEMTLLVIRTPAGEFSPPDGSSFIPAGGSLVLSLAIDEPKKSGPIDAYLPQDFEDAAPERTDRLDELLNAGRAVVVCDVHETGTPGNFGEVLRAAIPLHMAKH